MTLAYNLSSEFGAVLERAEEFHGHLGPFLVIGVRIGLVGLDEIEAAEDSSLTVAASLPLRVPFSCIIDGLQITTRCTIGNQKLSVKDSSEIRAEFKRKNDGRKVVVALNQRMFEKLKFQLLQEKLSDEEVRQLAWKVAAIPQEELLVVT